MNSKSLLIAIAALALTASGAQAFSGETLRRAGLSESQRAAFAIARELREEGDTKAARDVLVQAGIDEKVIERVRSVAAGENSPSHDVLHAALEGGDYDTFMAVISESPLADIIVTRDDFEQFHIAHELTLSGDVTGAKEIFTELGIPQPRKGYLEWGKQRVREEFTEEQQAALLVAKAANDREAIEAIYEEAGIRHGDSHRPKYLRDGREIE